GVENFFWQRATDFSASRTFGHFRFLVVTRLRGIPSKLPQEFCTRSSVPTHFAVTNRRSFGRCSKRDSARHARPVPDDCSTQSHFSLDCGIAVPSKARLQCNSSLLPLRM